MSAIQKAADVSEICADVQAETEVLRALVDRGEVDPLAVTPFHGWRVRDSVAHIVTINRLALLAFTDPGRFAVKRQMFADGVASPVSDPSTAGLFARMAAYEDSRWRALDWDALRAEWAQGTAALLAVAQTTNGDVKVDWFGAPIRVASLLGARQMEIWAYGLDIFDRYSLVRVDTDRIRNIAEFAIRTFGFSFAVRGLPAPVAKPLVVLTSPSGAIWRWNNGDPATSGPRTDSVTGSAVDLCLVATQRRHIDDTALRVEGDIARQWMHISQCISGPALDGPAPGERLQRPVT